MRSIDWTWKMNFMVNDAAEEFENKVLNEEIVDSNGNVMSLHDPYNEMVYPSPLIVPKTGPQNERKDSFFRCLSYGLYHKHGRFRELREQLLLHFIFILFLNENVTDIDSFLNAEAKSLVLREEGLRHPAIQMWVYRMRIARNANSVQIPSSVMEWVRRDKVGFCKSAQLFVEFNKKDGVLSCKYTFAYLMADKFGLHIRFYEHIVTKGNSYGKIQSSGWMHPPASLSSKIMPPSDISTPRDLDHDTSNEKKETTTNQGYSLTLLYAHRRFKLLQPRLRKGSAVGELSEEQQRRLFEAGMKQMPKYDCEYILRVYTDDSVDGPTNTVVGAFEKPRLKGGKVHTYTLDPACLSNDRVFQIYPGRPRVRTFSFPENHGLFLYVVESSGKKCKLISYLKRDSDYLYFALPAWAKQLAVLLADTEATADAAIRNELKLEIIKT